MKQYEMPEMKIISLSTEDVIMASHGGNDNVMSEEDQGNTLPRY